MQNRQQIISLIKKATTENGFQLEEGVLLKINTYLELLNKWNQKINLTAHRQVEDLIYKDIVDALYMKRARLSLASAGLAPMGLAPLGLAPNTRRSYIDFGAGAGFLGIIEAIIDPNLEVGFMDSDRKKINFIRQVCRELQLGKSLFLNIRGEQFPSEWKEYFEIIATRATLKIKDFLEVAHYYVQNNGLLFFMAGKALKKDAPEGLDFKGLERVVDFNYTISPKNYERKIISFKKNGGGCST